VTCFRDVANHKIAVHRKRYVNKLSIYLSSNNVKHLLGTYTYARQAAEIL